MGYIVRNPEPTMPKPLIFPNGRKPSKKEVIYHTEYSISFYKERLVYLDNNEPLFFKKKWKEKRNKILDKISKLEYKLLELTNPEIIKEVENCIKN